MYMVFSNFTNQTLHLFLLSNLANNLLFPYDDFHVPLVNIYPPLTVRYNVVMLLHVYVIHVQFDCCGFESFDEWLETDYFNLTMRFPDSCNCTNSTDTLCLQAPVDGLDQLIYDRNCSASVRSFIEENLIVVGAVGIVFGIIEVS